MTTTPINTHPVAEMYAKEHAKGELSRREFLARTTALGLTSTAAYALIGAQKAEAAAHAKKGGTIRMQMEVSTKPNTAVFKNFKFCIHFTNRLL